MQAPADVAEPQAEEEVGGVAVGLGGHDRVVLARCRRRGLRPRARRGPGPPRRRGRRDPARRPGRPAGPPGGETPSRSASFSRTDATDPPAKRDSRSRAARVSGPQMPSARQATLRWKSRRASAVWGPKMPSPRAGVEAEGVERLLEVGDVVAAEHRPSGGRGAGRRAGSRPRPAQLQVWRPQTPSTRRPRAVWNARTARGRACRRSGPASAGGGLVAERRQAVLQIAHRLAVGARADERNPGARGCPPRLRRSWATSAPMNSASSSRSWPLLRAPTRRFSGCAVLEHEQRRDAHHVEAAGDVGVVVDVELGDRELARLLVGDLLEDRGDHLARPAPLGPEVDEDGRVGRRRSPRRRSRR